MKVKVSKGAPQYYCTSLGRFGVINWKWYTIIELIAGETLTVETDYLFSSQFNIAPLTHEEIKPMIEKYKQEKGEFIYNTRKDNELQEAINALTTSGIRLMEIYVDEVIDDIRPFKVVCSWCGKVSDRTCEDDKLEVVICPHCNKDGYTKSLASIHQKRYDAKRGIK